MIVTGKRKDQGGHIMTKYTLHPIHIDLEKTWLMDFDEYYGGKKTYSKYLIEPYGPYPVSYTHLTLPTIVRV